MLISSTHTHLCVYIYFIYNKSLHLANPYYRKLSFQKKNPTSDKISKISQVCSSDSQAADAKYINDEMYISTPEVFRSPFELGIVHTISYL